MKMQLTLSATGLILMAACADSGSNYQPILDGSPTPVYQADLDECQALAHNQTQFDEDTIAATVLGAGVGAVLGCPSETQTRSGYALRCKLAVLDFVLLRRV